MKWFMIIIFTNIAFVASSEETKVKAPDCYCTDKEGKRIELGTMVCMKVDHRNFIARCEMSLNNPMWREIKQGCLSSSNQPSNQVDPLLDTQFIDT